MLNLASNQQTKLILIRHGRTAWNAQQRIQGQADIPLDEHGRLQALWCGETLAAANVQPVVIYTSDLSRCLETALIIAEKLSAPEPVLDYRLRERNWGEAEGLQREQLHLRYGDRHDVIPGAETMSALVTRVNNALRAYAERHRGETAVVVSHAGAIGNWLREHLRLSERPRIANAEAVALVCDPDPHCCWRLEGRWRYDAQPN